MDHLSNGTYGTLTGHSRDMSRTSRRDRTGHPPTKGVRVSRCPVSVQFSGRYSREQLILSASVLASTKIDLPKIAPRSHRRAGQASLPRPASALARLPATHGRLAGSRISDSRRPIGGAFLDQRTETVIRCPGSEARRCAAFALDRPGPEAKRHHHQGARHAWRTLTRVLARGGRQCGHRGRSIFPCASQGELDPAMVRQKALCHRELHRTRRLFEGQMVRPATLVRAHAERLSIGTRKTRAHGGAPAREQWPARRDHGCAIDGKPRPNQPGWVPGGVENRSRQQSLPAAPNSRPVFRNPTKQTGGPFFLGGPRFENLDLWGWP